MRVNHEIRAAEIIAAIQADYPNGGWFEIMSTGERKGWCMHENEWWTGMDYGTPSSAREWAGWLAREAYCAIEVR